MACLVKRSNGEISKVLISDGKTASKAYYDILNEVNKGIPSDVALNVSESLQPYVGKVIKSLDSPSELALGLYAQIYSQDFKSWYGDWTTTGQEPAVTTVDGMKVFKNSKGEVRSIYNNGVVKQKKSDYYRSVATKRTSTLTDYVKKSIALLDFRIKEARQQRDKVNANPKLSFEEKTKQAKYFNDIISDSIQKKEQLKEKNELEYVYLVAETDLDMASDILLNSSKTTMGELRIAYRAVEAWKNIVNILGVGTLEELTEEDQARISSIRAKAIDLNERLLNLSIKLIGSTYSKDPNDLFNLAKSALKGANLWKAFTRDISTTGIPIVNLLAKIIQEANLKIDKEHYRIYSEIDDAYNKIKNKQEIKANGFNIFFKEQTNKLGQKTLGLVGRYSQTYYNTMRLRRNTLNDQLEKAGNNAEAKRRAYDEYNSWVAKNTILFNALPFITPDSYTNEQRDVVMNDMKSLGFTQAEIADMIKESNRLYKKYQDDKERYRIGLNVDLENDKLAVPEGKTEQEYIDSLVKEWDDIHNPLKYISQMIEPKLVSNYAYKGMWYSLKVPRKTVEGKDSNYYDSNFAKIAADKDLLDFYIYFRDFIKQNLDYFPDEEVGDLQSNFLPVITERLAKEYGLTNLKESVQGLGDWFMKFFTSVEYNKRERLDPVTGKVVYDFNPRFIDEGGVAVEERSRDMVTMMKMFGDMGLIYKHKLQVQEFVDAINEIVQSTQNTIETDEFGKEKIVAKSPNNLKAMVESEIVRSFYGVNREKEMTSQRRFYNAAELMTLGFYKSDKYKQAKALEEEIKKINTELEDPNTSEKRQAELQKLLREKKMEHQKLGGRQFSVQKTLDSNIKYTRLLGLAFQPFSALRNLAIGGINNVIHSYGGADFSWAELKTATAMVKDSIARFWSKGKISSEQAEKLLKFMLDTGTVEGEDGIFKGGIITKKTTLDQIKEKLPNAYVFMKSTDFLFKSQSAVAAALKQKIKTEKGEVSLYKALNNNLEFDEQKYGKYNAELNGGKEFEEIYDQFMLKVGQLNKKLHGLSTTRTGLMAKDSIVGRLIFLFKTWLPETLASRYEARRYDPFLDRDVEGYMRTLVRKMANDGFKETFEAIRKAMLSEAVGDMSELERENLRKAVAEVAMYIAITAMYLVLKGMAPDEDDEDRKKWNIAINQMKLLQRDLLYYVSYESWADIGRQVFPSLTSLQVLGNAAAAAFWHYPMGITGLEVDDDGEPLYDGERTFLKITKALPVLNNINRIKYYEQKLSEAR